MGSGVGCMSERIISIFLRLMVLVMVPLGALARASASMLSMRRDAASSSHATLGPAAGARAGAPGPAGAPRPKGRRGFVLELSAAHRDLVSLLEGRLAEEDTAEGEREMLLAHLRLSKSVLRSVSDASGEAAGDGELAPGSEPNLTRLANVCAAMLDD